MPVLVDRQLVPEPREQKPKSRDPNRTQDWSARPDQHAAHMTTWNTISLRRASAMLRREMRVKSIFKIKPKSRIHALALLDLVGNREVFRDREHFALELLGAVTELAIGAAGAVGAGGRADAAWRTGAGRRTWRGGRALRQCSPHTGTSHGHIERADQYCYKDCSPT